MSSSLDAETRSAGLEIETFRKNKSGLGAASALGVVRIAKGGISSIRTSTALSRSGGCLDVDTQTIRRVDTSLG